MLDYLTMFREGGPFLYLILVLAIGLSVAPLVAALTSSLRWRVPVAVWIVLGMLPLVAGLYGTQVGMGLALQAVAHASPEMAATMAAAGFAVSLYSSVLGAMAAAILLAALAVGLALGTVASPKVEFELTLPGAVPGLLVLGMGLVPVFFGIWVLAVVVALAGVALMVVGARFPVAGDGVDAARVAAARVAVGTLGALAALTAGVQAFSEASVWRFHAMANASAEMKARLIAESIERTWVSLTVPTVAAALVFGGGLLAVALVVRHLSNARSLGSAAAAGAVLIPVALVGALGATSAGQLNELTISVGDRRSVQRAAAGVVLPTVGVAGARGYSGPVLLFGNRAVTLDDEIVQPSDFRGASDFVVEASGSSPLSELMPFMDKVPGAQVGIAVDAPEGPRTLPVVIFFADGPSAEQSDWNRRVEPLGQPRVKAFPSGGGWRIESFDGGDTLSDSSEVPTREERGPQLVEFVHLQEARSAQVWFEGESTVQDLVDVLAAANTESVEIFWRVDAEPEPEPVGVRGRDEIQQVIRRHNKAFRYCYEKELMKRPGLSGGIKVAFTIAPGGSVTAATTVSTLEAPEVERCVKKAFLRMKFPAGEALSEVRYPLVFSPTE